MASWPVTVDEGNVFVEVADAVYPIAAVHGAVVLFVERAWLRLETPAAGRTGITLRLKRAASREELAALGGDFLNELLHQALRVEVGARTEKLRELVIGRAVMSAETAPDSDAVAFHDDPLGIARPWEERYLGEENGGRK
ncbi:MAG: hypothetical protein EXR72_23095 [Myxococcales bacterium]|nr:hypothetical protein [Myxococcales bacterium]